MAKTKLTKQELPKGLLLQIDLKDIIPSKTNPRKEFKEDALNDLAASIKSVGLMQPLVVHKAASEIKYGLISGERRFRAAALAGLEYVPCMAYDKLSDEIVLEMQITENLQRQDINPMEESDAFQQLITMGMATAEVIADKLGKSTKYVYDRIILQKVVPEVQQSIREGKLTVTHGKQFARLPFFEQAKIVEQIDMDDITVADLRDEISSMFKLKLENAAFDITSKTLVKKAGACTSCNKRSGCNLVLFDDVKEDDICFDAECWKSKVDAHIPAVIEKLKAEGKDVVMISSNWDTKLEGVISNRDWAEFDEDESNDEESNLYGIIVETGQYTTGYKIGQVVKLEDDRNVTAPVMARNNSNQEEDEEEDDFYETPTSKQYRSKRDITGVFAKKVITALLAEPDFETQYQNVNNFIRSQICLTIDRLGESCQQFVCQLFGLEMPAEDFEGSIEEFFSQQIKSKIGTGGYWFSVGGQGELATMFYIVELIDYHVDGYFDITDWHDVNEFFQKAQGIDFGAIMNEMNTQAGETIISLPEAPKP